MELAQKYEIGAVKDFITEHITSEWPATLSEWRCQQAEIARLEEILCSSCNAARGTDGPYLADLFPEPASVIRLCVKYNIPGPLAAAFYQLSKIRFEDDYERWKKDKAGRKWRYCEFSNAADFADHSPLLNWRRTARWSSLDSDIFMRLLVGRKRLDEYKEGLVQLKPVEGCEAGPTFGRSCCESELLKLSARKWDAKHGEPMGPLEEVAALLAALQQQTLYPLICKHCRAGNRKKLEDVMTQLWAHLSMFFGVRE